MGGRVGGFSTSARVQEDPRRATIPVTLIISAPTKLLRKGERDAQNMCSVRFMYDRKKGPRCALSNTCVGIEGYM